MAVALIVAAGSGERLGAGGPKALVPVGGRPMLEWSLIALAQVPAVSAVVVALPASALDFPLPPGVLGVAGGGVRSESVRAALEAAPDGDPILVHDAARPLVTAEICAAGLAALERFGADAAIATAPVTDTIKRVRVEAAAAGPAGPAGPTGARVVAETLVRAELEAVQTPQVFRRAALRWALDVPPATLQSATDDAWLVERAGGRVVTFPGSVENFKITTPHDLRVAELLLSER